MEFPYRKRQRIPASCSVCRKRKSKCDRIKPICGSCKKKSIAHLCYYESDKVELSPNDTNSMNYGGMGPIKANSPGEPTQVGIHSRVRMVYWGHISMDPMASPSIMKDSFHLYCNMVLLAMYQMRQTVCMLWEMLLT